MTHAVILAGGVRSGQELPGSQLPRALWPIAGETVISGVIRFLHQHGVEQISICANGKTKIIANALASAPQPWENLNYSEDRFPRGPAGCLKDLESHLGQQPFVVIQGTAIYDFDLHELLTQHRETGADITVGAVRRDAGKADEPAGIYVMNPSVLQHVSPLGYQDIKEQLLPKLRAAGGKIRCHRIRGQVNFIHGCEHYLESLPGIIKTAAARPDHGMALIAPNVWAHPSAKIDPSVRFVGPAWIEADVQIAAGAILLGPALLAQGVNVGAGSLLRRVVLMKDAIINQNAEIADRVIAPGVCVANRSVSPASTTDASMLTQRSGKSFLLRALGSMDFRKLGRQTSSARLSKAPSAMQTA